MSPTRHAPDGRGGWIPEPFVSSGGKGVHAHLGRNLVPNGFSPPFAPQVDVYSFGIVMWEIWTRREPFEHLGDFNAIILMFNVVRGGR